MQETGEVIHIDCVSCMCHPTILRVSVLCSALNVIVSWNSSRMWCCAYGLQIPH